MQKGQSCFYIVGHRDTLPNCAACEDAVRPCNRCAMPTWNAVLQGQYP